MSEVDPFSHVEVTNNELGIDVNGNNAAPLYMFLKSEKGGFLVDGIKWNFTKFLVNKEGKVIQRYGPRTPPLEFEKDIQDLLSSSSY